MLDKLLQENLLERGMTRAALALELGVDPGHLSNIINGKRSFSGDMAKKMAEFLNISESTLNELHSLAKSLQTISASLRAEAEFASRLPLRYAMEGFIDAVRTIGGTDKPQRIEINAIFALPVVASDELPWVFSTIGRLAASDRVASVRLALGDPADPAIIGRRVTTELLGQEGSEAPGREVADRVRAAVREGLEARKAMDESIESLGSRVEAGLVVGQAVIPCLGLSWNGYKVDAFGVEPLTTLSLETPCLVEGGDGLLAQAVRRAADAVWAEALEHRPCTKSADSLCLRALELLLCGPHLSVRRTGSKGQA